MSEEKKETTLEPGKIRDLGYYFLNLLSAKAWQYMGLLAHPEDGQIHVDLKEAKLAIDLYALILRGIKEEMTPGETNELETNLSNLQLNFVQKKKETDEQQISKSE
ncbi:MAG: hypothetical protein PWP04_121 [Candidatus Atribacteria bacterium]|nr:hypothetical protein [Candidatus Atribacteria bacterium]